MNLNDKFKENCGRCQMMGRIFLKECNNCEKKVYMEDDCINICPNCGDDIEGEASIDLHDIKEDAISQLDIVMDTVSSKECLEGDDLKILAIRVGRVIDFLNNI